MYAYPENYRREQENEKDHLRIMEFYPDQAKEIFPCVKDICDKMEYDGSPMYASCPDKEGVHRICKGICGRCPEGKEWPKALVEVLLYDEMHRRRCRRRNCKIK